MFSSKKLNRTNDILPKLRYFIPLYTLVSIHYALFYSYISYDSIQLYGVLPLEIILKRFSNVKKRA